MLRFIRLFLAACGFASAAFSAEPVDPFEAADRLFSAGQYQEAETAFHELLARETNPAVRGKATFNLGLTLKQLGRYDEAIKVFKSLFDQPVNDKEPGGDLMEPYRNYRPRAQWEIGNCLLAKKEYARARDAFHTTKQKYPFQSWCGNEQAEYQYRYALFDGLCLEHLAKPREALRSYYQAAFGTMGLYSSPTVHFRIVNMYEASGQVNALKALLDQIDEHFFAMFAKEAERAGQKLDPRRLEEFRPTALMRRILELRAFAKAGSRAGLIACLKIRGAVTGPPDDNGNWEAIEVARLLALTPKESTREILATLTEPNADSISWKAYALGRCGAEDGLAWLKERASKEENWWAARSLIYSISQAGEKGGRAIGELDQTAKHNLKLVIERFHEGRLSEKDNGVIFPELPSKVHLPESLAELDEEVAYRKSLPKVVTVDLSTPESALNCLLLALVIEDKKAFDICTGGNPRWQGRFKQREFRPRLPRFTVGKASYSSDSEAEVSFEFGDAERIEKGVITLVKDAKNGWRVTDSKAAR